MGQTIDHVQRAERSNLDFVFFRAASINMKKKFLKYWPKMPLIMSMFRLIDWNEAIGCQIILNFVERIMTSQVLDDTFWHRSILFSYFNCPQQKLLEIYCLTTIWVEIYWEFWSFPRFIKFEALVRKSILGYLLDSIGCFNLGGAFRLLDYIISLIGPFLNFWILKS